MCKTKKVLRLKDAFVRLKGTHRMPLLLKISTGIKPAKLS